MKHLNTAVAARISRIRQQKNITQHAMAQALNICDSAYSKLEAGKTELTLNKIYIISEILQEEIHTLLGLTPHNAQQPDASQSFISAHYMDGSIQLTIDTKTLKNIHNP